MLFHPSAGLLVRDKSGANLDKCDPLETAGDTTEWQTGWLPVFPYTTTRHPYNVASKDLIRPSQPAAALALVGALPNGPRLVLRSARGICTSGKLAPGQPRVIRE